MLRLPVTTRWYRVAPLLLLLPGCLVSFNDYPLGATAAGGSAGAAGGASAGKVGVSGAAAGGSAGSGMIGQAGAEQTAGRGPLSTPASMIDDFEDGDQDILEHEGRSGSWHASNDGQGMQTPAANMALLPSLLSPARAASGRGVHTFGGPFSGWGALIGTSLAPSGDGGYDVRAYQGIRFWVRSGGIDPALAKQVRFEMPTPQTNGGGACTTCHDHFGAVVPLTSQWVLIELSFADLAQEGFGVPAPPSPDLERVTSIRFFVPRGMSFDFWVDDIELF